MVYGPNFTDHLVWGAAWVAAWGMATRNWKISLDRQPTVSELSCVVEEYGNPEKGTPNMTCQQPCRSTVGIHGTCAKYLRPLHAPGIFLRLPFPGAHLAPFMQGFVAQVPYESGLAGCCLGYTSR